METTLSVDVYEVWAAQCVNRSCGECLFKTDVFILRFLSELWLIAGLLLAVASLTFLVWDVLTTWDEELAFIWRSVTNHFQDSRVLIYILSDIPLSNGQYIGLHRCSNANSCQQKAAHLDPLPLCFHSVRPNDSSPVILQLTHLLVCRYFAIAVQVCVLNF